MLLCAAALALRCCGVWHDVFRDDGINLQGVDPWYHLRRIEHLARQFPYLMTFDPYALHPGGDFVFVGPLYDLVAVGVAHLISGSAPSARLLHSVAALMPPVGGALLVVIVYLLGKALCSRRSGLLAAGLIVVMPGPLLRCTMLGFADHHVLETLFASLVLLCLIHSLQALDALPAGNQAWRMAGFALAAGVALGAYLLVWVGGVMLVALLAGWVGVFWLVRFARREPLAPAAGCLLELLVTATLVVAPFHDGGLWTRFQLLGLAGLMVGAATLTLAAALMGRWQWSLRRAFLSLTGLVVAAGVLLGRLRPEWVDSVQWLVSFTMFGAQRQLVEEASPLFSGSTGFTLRAAWTTFATVPLLGAIGAVMLVLATVRRYSSARLLFLVWTCVMLAATVQQRRFAYYSGVNLALLASYAADALLARAHGSRTRCTAVWAAMALFVVAPALHFSLRTAGDDSGPLSDWRAALAWLRANTPEPFGSEEFYHARYGRTPADNPRAAYGVLTAWDRGYWVIALARRVPCANPTQARAAESSAFFVATSEAEAAQIVARAGAGYVMIDYTVPIWQSPDGKLRVGGFESLARWAGKAPGDFFQRCRTPLPGGGMQEVMVYFPEYFRSMAARLYTFAGEAYAPKAPFWVLNIAPAEPGSDPAIRDARRFDSHADAQAFVDQQHAQGQRQWRLASFNPFESCVPLEALARFQCVYGSPSGVGERDGKVIKCVQVYACTPAAGPSG